MSRSRLQARQSAAALARHEPGEFRKLIQYYPVIPAVRSAADLPLAVQSPSRVTYLLAASLSSLNEYLQALRAADKEVIVNLDLFAGLSRDAQAVAYLASSGCAGIISTHTDVLGAAQSHPHGSRRNAHRRCRRRRTCVDQLTSITSQRREARP